MRNSVSLGRDFESGQPVGDGVTIYEDASELEEGERSNERRTETATGDTWTGGSPV